MKGTGIALLVGALALAGCQPALNAATIDKAGTGTLVLRLATVDGDVNGSKQEPGNQAFLDALSQVSGGRIKPVLTSSFAEGAADPESTLVRAIAAGRVDGGWPATRAFAAGGIPGLQAFEAPFALTSYDALRDALRGQVRTQALAALDDSQINGLGLTIAGLRRPFSAKPMESVTSWKGLRLKALNSPVQDATFTRLGSVPVHTRITWRDDYGQGTLKLDGTELGLGPAVAYGMPFEYYPTNLVLWPKVSVLSINRAKFDALSAQQRQWIQAAADVAEDASSKGHYDEADFVQALCQSGVRPYTMPAQVLAALHVEAKPVLDRLSNDPAEAPLLHSVLEVAAAHPEPDASTEAASCSATPATPEIPNTVAPIPDGKYRAQITSDDIQSAQGPIGGHYTGTWTIALSNGTYAFTCTYTVDPKGDCGKSGADPNWVLEAGKLRGNSHVVHFVYDHALHDRLVHCGPCQSTPTKNVGWRLAGNQLTFFDVGQPVGDPLLIIKPWTKVS